MKKDDILQFDVDDTSEVGINGKQVFFTKRINGQTTHNKVKKENKKTLKNNYNEVEDQEDDDLYIEFKTTKKIPIEKPKKKKNKQTKQNQPKRKNKAKKIKINKLKIAILFLVIIGITVFTMLSPIFNIQEIEVKGNEKISNDTVESLSGVQEGQNIFRVIKKNIIKNLKENTYIDNATIKRIIPGTLEITIQEREVAYQIKVINSYVYIDYQGYILEVSSKDAKVPIIEGIKTKQDTLLNGKRLSNDDIDYLKVLLKIMEEAKNINIANYIDKITIKDGEYILDLSSQKKTVNLGDATYLTNKMSYLKAILLKEKGNKGEIFLNGNLNTGFKPFFREEQRKKAEEKDDTNKITDTKDSKEKNKE